MSRRNGRLRCFTAKADGSTGLLERSPRSRGAALYDFDVARNASGSLHRRKRWMATRSPSSPAQADAGIRRRLRSSDLMTIQTSDPAGASRALRGRASTITSRARASAENRDRAVWPGLERSSPDLRRSCTLATVGSRRDSVSQPDGVKDRRALCCGRMTVPLQFCDMSQVRRRRVPCR